MESIQLNDFLKFRYISNLQESPMQTQMAFTVAIADEEKNEYQHELYLSDGKKVQKLLKLKNKASIIWETEQSILVQYAKNKQEEKLIKDEKKTIYYRFNLIDRTIEKAYIFPFLTSIVKVLDQQKLLLQSSMTSSDHLLYLSNESERKELLKNQKKQTLYEDISEIPFYFNGQGFIANQRNQLLIYDVELKSITPIVDSDFSVGVVRVSSDLKHIYYTGQQMTGVRSLTTHVFVYHVEQKDTEILYHENDCSIANLYLLKDKIIVAGRDMKDFGINQNVDFFELKQKRLELFNLYRGSLGNSVGSDVRLNGSRQDVIYQNKIYFISTVDDHNELCSLDVDGNLHMEYQINGSLDGFVVVNHQFFGVALVRQKLQEIYALDLKMNKMDQITRLNQRILKNHYVATPKEIYVKKPSHVVKGFVLYPKDFDAKKTYPAILDIHGGPKTVYGKVYYHEMQVWANLGYFVFFANPRGSDGKGDHFADIRGKYGTIDYEDLMEFTDLVIKKTPQIDTNKLFVTGGSYGGFMTNWIIGHTGRFKAAVTQRSISNWISFHGTSDIGFYFSKDQTDGHPLTDLEKLWEQSPIKYVDAMKTPLLIIHSDQDYRCPVEQGYQLFTMLKEKGVETKMVMFKGENHELSRSGKPQARIKRLSEITAWFERFR